MATTELYAEVVCAPMGLFDILAGKASSQIDVAGNLVVPPGYGITTADFTTTSLTTTSLTTLENATFDANVSIAGNAVVQENFAVVLDAIVGNDLIVNGNLLLMGTPTFAGNLTLENLKTYDLYVHNIFGFSPINFGSPVLTSNPITLSGLENFLQTTFGAKISIMDGGDAEIHGGNLMVTPVGAVGGGHVMLMSGADCQVMGGNIMVTPVGGSSSNGGKIMVADGGQVHIQGNATMLVGDSNATQMIMVDSGNVRVQGPLSQSAIMFHDQTGVPRAFLTGEVLQAVRIAATPASSPSFFANQSGTAISWTSALDNTNGVSFHQTTGIFTAPRNNFYSFTLSMSPIVNASGGADNNVLRVVVTFPTNGAPFTPQLFANNFIVVSGTFNGYVTLNAAVTAYLDAGQSVQPLLTYTSNPYSPDCQVQFISGTDYLTITELPNTIM